ncbi:MAG: zinc ABC transporter substrate-binding protein [Dehalococcoidales bacterium]|nr:zinc ABC transporter substrate-binding protein [Dehalococcoidales bacterium]
MGGRNYWLALLILVLTLVANLVSGGCTAKEAEKLQVVTSTSLLAQIVERVGGEKVDVVNIIPPAQCPGHFDVKPGDIQRLADAGIFLMHGWQGEKFTDDLITSANNPDLSVFVIDIDIKDNWMTPQVQSQAIDIITGIISQADSKNSADFQKNADGFKAAVNTKGTEMAEKLAEASVSEINVICAEQQTGFVQWAGFNIVATFGRPDSLTPQVVKDLVDSGRESNVTLIIDNMQSGQDAGVGVAEELGSARVILSNFPGCYENTETWEKTIEYNVALLLAAIGQ